MTNKKSRTAYSIRNVLSGCVGQGVQTLSTFISRMVFTRCLTSEYLGINGLFSNILSTLSLAELGIGTAIVYELYKTIATNDDEKTASLMKFYGKAYKVIGIVVTIIGIVLIPFLQFFTAEPPQILEDIRIVYLFYLCNTALSYFFAYKRSILIADQKNYIVTLVQYSCRVVQDIIQIAILVCTKNFLLYLSCQIIMTFVYNLIVSIIANKHYPILRRKDIKPLQKETKESLVTNIKALVIRKLSAVLVTSTDSIIISSIVGLAVNGVTSNYVLLTNTLNTVLTQVFNGLTASIGNINAVETKEKKMKVFYVINFMNFWLFGWCSISFLILASDIVSVCFGNEYVMSDSICLIMALNFYTAGMQNAIWTYRSTLGVFDKGKYLTLITGILNIVLSVVFGLRWGVMGILVATLVARTLTNIWYDPYSIFKYGFGEKSRDYFIRYISLFVVLIVTYLLTKGVTVVTINVGNCLLKLIINVIICIIVPNICFMIIFRKSIEFSFLKEKIAQIIKDKFK